MKISLNIKNTIVCCIRCACVFLVLATILQSCVLSPPHARKVSQETSLFFQAYDSADEENSLSKYHLMLDTAYADSLAGVLQLYMLAIGKPPKSLKQAVKDGFIPLPPSYEFDNGNANRLVCPRSDCNVVYDPEFLTILAYNPEISGKGWDGAVLMNSIASSPDSVPYLPGKAIDGRYTVQTIKAISDPKRKRTVLLALAMQSILYDTIEVNWKYVKDLGYLDNALRNVCEQMGFTSLKDPYTGGAVLFTTDSKNPGKARFLVTTYTDTSIGSVPIERVRFEPLDDKGNIIRE
jgi:hypothetical protein